MKFTSVLLIVIIFLVLLLESEALPTPAPQFPFTVNQKRTESRKKSVKPKRTSNVLKLVPLSIGIVIDSEDVLKNDIKK